MVDLPTIPADIDLALAPLSLVAERLRADLATIGQDKRCGECEQFFTEAGPVHGVIRQVAMSDAGISMVSCLICEFCARKARHRSEQGGRVATKQHRAHALEFHGTDKGEA